MVQYGLYCWSIFVGVVIVASWVMWLDQEIAGEAVN